MDVLTFIMNIGSALAMGIAIGLERQVRMHAAGLRTNTLVCVGAALFVSLSTNGKDPDSTRIAAQVVSGIGFLGGGVILREGLTVRGLATAATLWCSAAVGTLAGAGRIADGFIGTAAILFVHIALRPLALKIETFTKGIFESDTLYRMRVTCPANEAVVIRSIFMRHVNAHPGMSVQGISMQDAEHSGHSIVVVEIFSSQQNDKVMNELVSRISIEPSVTAVSWERVR